jgi:hypothetical protein
MKKITLTLALAAIFIAGTITTSVAQTTKQKKTVTMTAKEKKTGEKIVDITNPKTTNVQGKPATETKTKGDVYGSSYCDVTIDNWTGYSIDVYIDGSYKGTIAPYDKRVTWAIPGTVKLYGEAAGTSIYWGTSTVDCDYSYTWKLTM